MASYFHTDLNGLIKGDIMKNIIRLVSFLSFALLLGGVTANAQSSTTKVDADIPFDFVVGDRSMPAGKYVLRISPNSTTVKVLEVRDKDNEIVYSGLITTSGDRNSSRTELKFDRIAGQAVLAGIVTAQNGYEVGTSESVKLIAGKRKTEAVTN